MGDAACIVEDGDPTLRVLKLAATACDLDACTDMCTYRLSRDAPMRWECNAVDEADTRTHFVVPQRDLL